MRHTRVGSPGQHEVLFTVETPEFVAADPVDPLAFQNGGIILWYNYVCIYIHTHRHVYNIYNYHVYIYNIHSVKSCGITMNYVCIYIYTQTCL